MTDKLKELEKQLGQLLEKSEMSGENLLLFPENFRQTHSFKIFDDDLLAMPANLIIDVDDEFEQKNGTTFVCNKIFSSNQFHFRLNSFVKWF